MLVKNMWNLLSCFYHEKKKMVGNLRLSWKFLGSCTPGAGLALVCVWTSYLCSFLQLVALHCLSEIHRQRKARGHQDVHKGLQLIRSMPGDLHWYQYPGLLHVNGTWKIYSNVASEDAFDCPCWHKVCSLTYATTRKVLEVSLASIHS